MFLTLLLILKRTFLNPLHSVVYWLGIQGLKCLGAHFESPNDIKGGCLSMLCVALGTVSFAYHLALTSEWLAYSYSSA